MGKVKSTYSCPHCKITQPTFSGVKRHITQTPACSKKDEDLFRKNSRLKARLGRLTDQPDGTAPPPPPPPPLPPSPPQVPMPMPNQGSDVDMAGVESEHIRRSPSVAIEDVPDEPYLETLRPLRRGLRELIEEMPQVYPIQPHPDPTAGRAILFEEIANIPPPLYDTSLTDPDTFREAYWLGNLSIPESKANDYFSLPRTRNWHWKNVKQFEAEIDNLPHGPDWYRQTIRVPTDDGEEILDLWMRDVVEVVEMLIRDRRERIYDEMWSGDWWWRLQNILGEGATIAPIILAADKTQMTMLSGNKSAWPVYLSIGNISKDLRRKPSERAMLLVGYIPISDLAGISNTVRRSERRWQLFHTCMESILEPLKKASCCGVEMLCADGGIRRVHPILAAYLADYPEQCLATCVRETRCPICWVPTEERANYDLQYGLREKHGTMLNLKDYWSGYSRGVETLGIRPNCPFWADLPYVDIFNCIAPDMLHQLNKGIFGDHIVKWCRSIMGKQEVDRRIKGTPRFSGLRHFTQGISVLKQWTGTEWKTLAKIFLPALAGCKRPEAAAAARNVLDFMYCVHKPEISGADLTDLDGYLADFHDLKDAFVGTVKERETMKDLLDGDERFHGIPKLHMLSHYIRFIRELGTPDGYNTEVPEHLHIDYVKVPWRASNHVNAIEQMATYLQRKEAWAFLRAYLHDTGILPDPRFGEEDTVDDDGIEDEVDSEGNGSEGEIWYPNAAISTAQRPTIGKKTLAYLINNHKAPDLIPATVQFLHRLPTTRPGSDFPLDHHDKVPVWTRCWLIHERLPFLPTVEPQVDQVRTLPPSVDSEGRIKRVGAFDVVLFEPEHRGHDANGLHRFQAGRIRAIFELPPHLKPYVVTLYGHSRT
ncbi:hypothetical protein FRC07_002288 [Ceratobasidium sp. 392]|nr:hypothetical protein FRC07_002288 [Ceratobasidium sp. 392]